MKFYRLIIVAIMATALTGSMMAQSAADIYKSKCQGCHGPNGKASAIGKKLGAKDFQDPDVQKMSRSDVIKVTSEGKNKMPAYQGRLTDDQIKELAKYIKELK